MRGKSKIWTLAVIMTAMLALSMVSVQKAYAENTISISPSVVGGLEPGDNFTVDLVLDEAWMVRAWELTVSWDPRILRLNALTPIVEGPFLGSNGDETVFVKSVGFAGSVTAANIIIPYSAVDGGGVLATVYFDIIGGGTTEIDLAGRLLDLDFVDIPITTEGGLYLSDIPMIDFKWYVPTAVELPPQDSAEVTGNGYYTTTDEEGIDLDYHTLPPYITMRPVLALDDNGDPESVVNVAYGTMFFGDEIIFDASNTYDFDANGDPSPLDPASFRWIIRAAGQDTIVYRGKTYDSRYESGDELDYGPVISYVFPGDLPSMYTLYGSVHLGWFDLTLEVTDSDDNVATYYTWIRIFRIVPGRTVMLNIPEPQHSLSQDGDTVIFRGKMQNQGGAGAFPYDALAVYLELARMVHGYFWGRIQFDVIDIAGNVVGTAYSDAIWFGPTETTTGHMEAAWTIPPEVGPGTYTVKAKGYFCASGVTWGFGATGAKFGTLVITP